MTAGLEGVIRPFETGDVSPPKPAPQGEVANPPDNLVIEIGSGGTVKSFSGSFSLDQTYYHVKKPKEKEQDA